MGGRTEGTPEGCFKLSGLDLGSQILDCHPWGESKKKRMEADLAKPRIGGTVVDAQDKWVHGHLVK